MTMLADQLQTIAEPLTTHAIARALDVRPSVVQQAVRDLEMPAAGFTPQYTLTQVSVIANRIASTTRGSYE